MLRHTKQRSQHHQAHDAFQQDSPARKLDKQVYIDNYIMISKLLISEYNIISWLITFRHVLNS